ncbi:phage holin family protein [Ornithinimicrobium avium]|uniref:Phage holin family protein n=1 Tax=Ornithinimicrobium avium TaxID=2283195 RepID=A0A345NMS5_9MICO|nr:phage holin family protein [Ornithinimicrobium avium]AXH96333.1 phage holin family protein [Ornithinimicrobium avium]
MKMILTIVANAVAIWVAAYLLDGIQIGGEGSRFFLTLLGVAVVFGVLNAIVKPILKLLSLPLIVLSLGLFLFILNALMLALTSWLAGAIGLDFHVDSFFWDAVLGAIIISAVSLVVDMLLPDARD